MNQKYIEYVKTAHKLCKEMTEIKSNPDDFYKKMNDYMLFAIESGRDDWHITLFIVRMAIVDYKLDFDAREVPEFQVFAEEYRQYFVTGIPEEVQRNHFLTEDLSYLRNIEPDQT
jgi:hypothetical protein